MLLLMLLVLLCGDSRMGMNPRLLVALGGAHLTLFISSVDSCLIKAFLCSAFGDTFTDGSSSKMAIKEDLIDINSSTTKQLVQLLPSWNGSWDLSHVNAELMHQVIIPLSSWHEQLNNNCVLFSLLQKQVKFVFGKMRLVWPNQDVSSG